MVEEISGLRVIDCDFQCQVLQKLGRLEAKMEMLAGNGQPGRMQLAEDRIVALERNDVRHNAATPRTQASAQRCVDLLERPCARAEILLAELVERHRAGVEMSVEVFGVGSEI